jgi:hypothetical protein
MEHYVTLFDSLFLPQGLALHASLERHAGDYALWVLCMDDEAQRILDQLDKPNVKTIALSEIETPQLLTAKLERTKGEYCWTLTPFTPKIVFDRDRTVQRVTYLDADLYFLKSPGLIFQEFEASGKSVLITEHAYAPEYDQSSISGHYCVQFMTFIRDESEQVRQWWQDRCLEWCFAKIEDGKFGDQKYLDDWHERFAKFVHVLQAKNLTLAPWNASRYPYSEAVLYHFHELRLLPENRVLLFSNYCIYKAVLDNIYGKYLQDFTSVIFELNSIGVKCKPQHHKVSFLFMFLKGCRQFKRQFFAMMDFCIVKY